LDYSEDDHNGDEHYDEDAELLEDVVERTDEAGSVE